MLRAIGKFFLVVVAVLCLGGPAVCDSVDAALAHLYRDAEHIDLRTSKSLAVVKLRDVIGIAAPDTIVLVKTFARDSLPKEIRRAFSKPGTVGVTINGRYVAIVRTQFADEYQDVLNHELVHAYITLASPKPLPFWFQEASAVKFSTDAEKRLYGRSSDKLDGVTEAKMSALPADYRQKLQSFNFLIERVGERRFQQWYRQAVENGTVDTGLLVGMPNMRADAPKVVVSSRPIWLGAIAVLVVVSVLIAGFVAAKRSGDFG